MRVIPQTQVMLGTSSWQGIIPPTVFTDAAQNPIHPKLEDPTPTGPLSLGDKVRGKEWGWEGRWSRSERLWITAS